MKLQDALLLCIVAQLLLAGCTMIMDSQVDLTQAGVISRSADGGSGTNDVDNTTSGTGGVDATLPVIP